MDASIDLSWRPHAGDGYGDGPRADTGGASNENDDAILADADFSFMTGVP